MVQLSHPYMTTGKTIALTRQTIYIYKMSIFIKVFIEFVTVLLHKTIVLCFGFLAMKHVGSELPAQGSNPPPCTGRQSLNH